MAPLIPDAVDAQEEGGHCIKAAHHALLMLDGVLALELLAHRVAELQHVRRWEVGRFTASRARLSHSELQVGGGASPSVSSRRARLAC